jgi:hypothetical protein
MVGMNCPGWRNPPRQPTKNLAKPHSPYPRYMQIGMEW